ncbi:MAG: (2Fe-2S) ferredoxin domain-containing protein [Ghiorsea sp.]
MKIEVCLGQNCKGYGGQALADELKQRVIPFKVSECRSLCTYAPVVVVDGKAKLKAVIENVIGSQE